MHLIYCWDKTPRGVSQQAVDEDFIVALNITCQLNTKTEINTLPSLAALRVRSTHHAITIRALCFVPRDHHSRLTHTRPSVSLLLYSVEVLGSVCGVS